MSLVKNPPRGSQKRRDRLRLFSRDDVHLDACQKYAEAE